MKKMKGKLISLVLMGSVALNVAAFETNEYKFIPKNALVTAYDIDMNGIIDFYWWDKNKDKRIAPDEIFIDLNQDGIPDICYEDVIKNHNLLNRETTQSI